MGLKQKQVDGLVFAAGTLEVANGVVTLHFGSNRYFSNHNINSTITMNVAASGNVPGNTIHVLITGDGENTITLPAACKVVRGAYNIGAGTKNLIQMQYLSSSFIVTKIYQFT